MATVLDRPAISPLPWPLWTATVPLLMGAMFRSPAKPASAVEIQAAYDNVLIAGVLAGAAVACARGKGGFRALLASGGDGGTRSGWVVMGTVSAWLGILVLGTFLPHGDAKANDVANSLHGRAAVDGWVLITCAIAPLVEELLWRRAIFTALAGAAAMRLGERRGIVLGAALSRVMIAAWHCSAGTRPRRSGSEPWPLCLVFWRTGSLLAPVAVHGRYNLGTIRTATVGVPGLPITLHGLPDMTGALIGIAIIWCWRASGRKEDGDRG